MKRLGVDLAAVEAPKLQQRVSDCPGAKLRISREDYSQLERGGERFVSPRNAIPVDGLGDARVFCEREVMTKLGCAKSLVEFGLCASCSALEVDNRASLRERMGRR